jgi:hypothetical protein
MGNLIFEEDPLTIGPLTESVLKASFLGGINLNVCFTSNDSTTFLTFSRISWSEGVVILHVHGMITMVEVS